MRQENSSKSILLVEDEALIAMTEAAMLEKNGYKVETVRSAKKAIAAVQENKFDLILMDIDLGSDKMMGTEAAEIILEKHDIPIVFLTSHSEKAMVDKVKGITNYGYVLKNAGEFVLLESVSMAFTLFESNKKIKEDEAELSAIYESAPVLMILVDKDRRVRKANAFAAGFSGTIAEALIGKRGGEALRCLNALDDPKGCGYGPKCNSCKIREIVLQTFENNQIYRKTEASLPFEVKGKRTTLTFLVSTSLLNLRDEQLCLVAIEDITELKNTQRLLEESEKNVKQLFQLTPDALLLADAETGIIVQANAAAEDLFGIPADALIGMNQADLYPDDQHTKAEKEFKKGEELLKEPLPPLEMNIDGSGNKKKTVELRASAFYMNKKLHLLGAFRDITERKNR